MGGWPGPHHTRHIGCGLLSLGVAWRHGRIAQCATWALRFLSGRYSTIIVTPRRGIVRCPLTVERVVNCESNEWPCARCGVVKKSIAVRARHVRARHVRIAAIATGVHTRYKRDRRPGSGGDALSAGASKWEMARHVARASLGRLGLGSRSPSDCVN